MLVRVVVISKTIAPLKKHMQASIANLSMYNYLCLMGNRVRKFQKLGVRPWIISKNA